jgi:hypothetical protein
MNNLLEKIAEDAYYDELNKIAKSTLKNNDIDSFSLEAQRLNDKIDKFDKEHKDDYRKNQRILGSHLIAGGATGTLLGKGVRKAVNKLTKGKYTKAIPALSGALGLGVGGYYTGKDFHDIEGFDEINKEYFDLEDRKQSMEDKLKGIRL